MSSILDLRTTAANNARRAHKVLFVAMVEAADGTWFELDAISKQHAENLAKDQVRNFNARGASCWEVSPITGKCFKRSFFVKFNNFESGD